MSRRQRKKAPPIGKLKEKAASKVQKLQRMEAADDNGYCECVTCKKWMHWKELQGGHYIERGVSETLLDERNINPQCPGCNCFAMKKVSGMLKYREFMVEWYGEDATKELEEKGKAKRPHKWNRVELEEKIKEYDERIKEEARRLGE